ncbi:MAG: PAS domain-containing protein, partial [Collinsella aerofaciens]|nr:PAS domain-containing protein [Collinsella aerofaciens]
MDRNELDPSVPSATEVKKIPLIIKVYAVLCILSGVGTLPSVAAFMWQVITALINGNAAEKLGDNMLVAVGLIVAGIMLSAASAVILIIFGLDLIKNQRRNAARLSYILIAFTVVELLVDVMLQGIGLFLLRPAIQLGILIALSATVDPTLRQERELQRRLREQNRTIGRQMDALGRRQREFAALAENMSEGVLLIDSRYHVLSGNQSAFHLLGEKQQPESIRQGTCRREIWEAAGKALAGRHAETLMRGESHIFEILASPVTANGQVTGAVILMVDVTEREERESLRREFSANVSHELKTPLTSISGFAELMKEGLVEADK